MFESQYNDEMVAEVMRLEAKARALSAGHPEWHNACISCLCRLERIEDRVCDICGTTTSTEGIDDKTNG